MNSTQDRVYEEIRKAYNEREIAKKATKEKERQTVISRAKAKAEEVEKEKRNNETLDEMKKVLDDYFKR